MRKAAAHTAERKPQAVPIVFRRPANLIGTGTLVADYLTEVHPVVDAAESHMATVCVIDHTTAGGDILQANRKCAYYMGWDKETLCGRPLEELAVKGPERERLMAAVDGAVPVACNVGFITEKRHKSPAVIATLPLISHASEHTHTMMLVTLEGRDKHRESLDYSDPYLAPALEPAALLGCHMIVRNMPQGAHIDSCSSAFLDLMVCTFEELQQGGPDGLFGPETLTTDLMHLTAAHHRSETFCTSCLLYRKEGPFRAWVAILPLVRTALDPTQGREHLWIVVDVTARDPEIVGRYQMGRLLGTGAFGAVRLARNLTTGEEAAVKFFKPGTFHSLDEIEKVQDEIRVLTKLKHQNIIRLLDSIQDPGGGWLLIMEYAAIGTLMDLVSRLGQAWLPEAEVKKVLLQVVDAVHYCHRRQCIHRDLKGENVLIDAQGRVKVADFGLAAITSPLQSRLSEFAGTPAFTAPEIFKGRPYAGAADIWSLGVIVYELLAGRLPFQGSTMSALKKAITKGQFQALPSHITATGKALVAQMLHIDAAARITIEDLHEHIWFSEPTEELPKEVVAASMQRFYDGGEDRPAGRGGITMHAPGEEGGSMRSSSIGFSSGRDSRGGGHSRTGSDHGTSRATFNPHKSTRVGQTSVSAPKGALKSVLAPEAPKTSEPAAAASAPAVEPAAPKSAMKSALKSRMAPRSEAPAAEEGDAPPAAPKPAAGSRFRPAISVMAEEGTPIAAIQSLKPSPLFTEGSIKPANQDGKPLLREGSLKPLARESSGKPLVKEGSIKPVPKINAS